MPTDGNKAPKSESAPYLQVRWPPWLKTWRRLAGITVAIAGVLLALLLLLPARTGNKQPIEWLLLRDLSSHIKAYSWQHNGLWPTNWIQITNTPFQSSPKLHYQSLFLPDHYVFIPHDQNWEIRPQNGRRPWRIVLLRASPNPAKGKSRPERYAIVFSPSDDPQLRDFVVHSFPEKEITNLLAQSRYSLPPLQKHDSRPRWLSDQKEKRRALFRGMFFLAILMLTPIAGLIAAYQFVKHRPIG